MGLGLAHGFIRSVSSLVALVIGLFFAKKLEPYISKVLAFVHIGNPKGVLGYFFVFFCIFIAVKLILLLLQKVTKATGLSPLDRALGGTLGLIKGIIITAIVSILLQIALPNDSAVLTNSRILPFTNKVLAKARVVLPNAFYQHVLKGKPIDVKEKIREEVNTQVENQVDKKLDALRKKKEKEKP
jgi:membrane protein required for colicin V production